MDGKSVAKMLLRNASPRYISEEEFDKLFPAMEKYANLYVRDAQAKKVVISNYQSAGFGIGIISFIVIELFFIFVFQPKLTMFGQMPLGRSIIVAGTSTVLFAIIGGIIGFLITTRMAYYKDYKSRKG